MENKLFVESFVYSISTPLRPLSPLYMLVYAIEHSQNILKPYTEIE